MNSLPPKGNIASCAAALNAALTSTLTLRTHIIMPAMTMSMMAAPAAGATAAARGGAKCMGSGAMGSRGHCVGLTGRAAAPGSRAVRGGAVRVSAGWVLKNTGPKTSEHLGAAVAVELLTDLDLSAARQVGPWYIAIARHVIGNACWGSTTWLAQEHACHRLLAMSRERHFTQETRVETVCG